ncbi:3-deoxy-8-phosphooctulonate synthase [Phycisphaerales bacterium AB-hyl4]|uniref:2-dehydro-3-deoxyphosphooctonate aldolase n=1 Tax=Natronomicrosphaera hydrolytica TaxID=3242702 RepID=A0ABV4U112_9BACT
MTTQTTKTLHVGPVPVGPDQPLTIIAGPCVAESRDLCLTIGHALRDRCQQLGLGYIFKASFDKANRSSIASDRGPGIDEGLRLLEDVKDELGVPVTTDVHESQQCRSTATVVDLLQIPAFLCRQTDLLVAAAETGRVVNVKKGQFLSPQEMGNVVRKLTEAKAKGIMLTERGTFFGYNRLVNDFVGLGDMMGLGQPVCFDVTHSTQQPGGAGTSSGGRPECAPLLARCAVAAGVHALFIETHPEPASARSDAATMLPLDRTLMLLEELNRLHHAMGSIRIGGSA